MMVLMCFAEEDEEGNFLKDFCSCLLFVYIHSIHNVMIIQQCFKWNENGKDLRWEVCVLTYKCTNGTKGKCSKRFKVDYRFLYSIAVQQPTSETLSNFTHLRKFVFHGMLMKCLSLARISPERMNLYSISLYL